MSMTNTEHSNAAEAEQRLTYLREATQTTAESWSLNIAPVGIVERPKGEKRAKVDFNYSEE